MSMKRLSLSIPLLSICMLRLASPKISFIRGLITSTFTEEAGIAVRITMAHGRLSPGGIFPRYYSGIALTAFDSTVT